jgi:hypothetical protein
LKGEREERERVEKQQQVVLEEERKKKETAGGGLGGLDSKGREFGQWVEKMKVSTTSYDPTLCAFLTRASSRILTASSSFLFLLFSLPPLPPTEYQTTRPALRQRLIRMAQTMQRREAQDYAQNRSDDQ